MPVTFVTAASDYDGIEPTTLDITPGAGSNYQLAFGYENSTDAYDVTFAGDTMTLLLSRINDPDGMFNRSVRMHGRAGDYTGASRTVTWSLGVPYRHVLTFSGVDQTTPTIGSGVVSRVSSGTSISATVTGADSPAGSLIVWGCAGFNNWTGGGATVNIGTIRAQPQQFSASGTVVGTVDGTGSDQTITVTQPSTDMALLLFAVVLREASGGGGGNPGCLLTYTKA